MSLNGEDPLFLSLQWIRIIHNDICKTDLEFIYEILDKLVEKNINKDKKKYYVVILKPLIPMPTEENTSYVSYMFSSKEEAQKAEGDTLIFKYIKTVEVEIDE